jgi:glutamate--cysteine ligase
MSAGALLPDLSALSADLEQRAFAASSPLDRRLGVEAELLPIDLATGRLATLDTDASVSLLRVVRSHAAIAGWREAHSAKGVPVFQLPDGAAVTFEPGGQLEYASPPCAGASDVLRRLRDVLLPLRRSARDAGIELLAAGIDPRNPIEQAPLQLFGDRYSLMADYFSRLGGAGARMMRQTAAFQVTLDTGDDPPRRWRLLNALAPYVLAIFANSPVYAGRDTGHRSWRAHVWRGVDSSRTGLPYGGAAVASYLEFALCAPDMMRQTAAGDYLPFVGWLNRGESSEADWLTHLSTLFPEVRPRGAFEVRSADAVAPEHAAAPLALLAGVVYDARAAAAAATLLGAPDRALLRRAGVEGLRDPAIAAAARALVDLALEGCEALGEEYFAPADLAEARDFFDRYTRRGLSPADNAVTS